MKNLSQQTNLWLILAGILAFVLITLLTSRTPFLAIAFSFAFWLVICTFGWSFQRGWHFQQHHWFGVVGLIVLLVIYFIICIWTFNPEILPQRVTYDFIENRHVSEQQVDPALFKVERWNILDEEHSVLFLHPSSSGSSTLVYPVMIKGFTSFYSNLAVAPQAWTEVGDGVTFSLYVEDNAGIHLLFSQYVDPKHQLQDRRWIPIHVSLHPFSGKLVRIILSVNSGPSGDLSYDWAGWGEPCLERPIWP